MKTIYLKKLKSGNYEICNRKESTVKFSTQREFKEWYLMNINGYTKFNRSFGSRIIKAKYRLSQNYFNNSYEFLTFIKQ